MKKSNLLYSVASYVLGAASFACAVCLITGLSLSDVFNIGNQFRERNKDFLYTYSLSQQNNAVILMILEKDGPEQARKALWRGSSSIYWDHINNTATNDLNRNFSNYFAAFVDNTEAIKTLADSERKFHNIPQATKSE